ncbi:hypothetical protein [Herpetosiphon sp. NSE202]|uniref:hypothetical protein n=1 Tax=Herpetosiphon sp. NSE202 TaxID=3351349 RepID=UPI00363C523E
MALPVQLKFVYGCICHFDDEVITETKGFFFKEKLQRPNYKFAETLSINYQFELQSMNSISPTVYNLGFGIFKLSIEKDCDITYLENSTIRHPYEKYLYRRSSDSQDMLMQNANDVLLNLSTSGWDINEVVKYFYDLKNGNKTIGLYCTASNTLTKSPLTLSASENWTLNPK